MPIKDRRRRKATEIFINIEIPLTRLDHRKNVVSSGNSLIGANRGKEWLEQFHLRRKGVVATMLVHAQSADRQTDRQADTIDRNNRRRLKLKSRTFFRGGEGRGGGG